ncbi:hypothetical protein MNBD_GAMMA03-810 [hydrothermal vent metagenome]|uniref:Uncharacterized protein n=1 Tax=hydrothermal vent metagenome TaxID=652676 RepID=A0A3B0W526_9ZZZZ
METIRLEIRGLYVNRGNKVGKYLTEIDIFAVKPFGENAIKVAGQTRNFVFSLSPSNRREVLSNFGKIVILLCPERMFHDGERSLKKYQYDDMSGVMMINIPFDLDVFLNAPKGEARNQIIYEIIKEVYSDLPNEIGLDGNIILERLEAFKENGFVVEKETSRAVRSPSKKVGARLHYYFDWSGIRVEARISRKGEEGEKVVLIGNYPTNTCCWIIEMPAKLTFEDEDTITFTPKSQQFEPVTISITRNPDQS